MSDDLTRLTDEEREQIGGYCIGSGEYPCMDDITHRHNLGCKLFDCHLEPGDIEHGMLTAVESILAARTAALLDRAERAERERDDYLATLQADTERRGQVSMELDALRAAVTGLADQWEERAAVRESPSVRREWTTGDGERMSSTGPHNPRNAAEGAIFDLCASRLRGLLTDEGDNDGQ